MATSACNSPDSGRRGSRERHLRNGGESTSNGNRSRSKHCHGARRKNARFCNGRHQQNATSSSNQEQAVAAGVAGVVFEVNGENVHKGQDLELGGDSGGQNFQSRSEEQVRWKVAERSSPSPSPSSSSAKQQSASTHKCQMLARSAAVSKETSSDVAADCAQHNLNEYSSGRGESLQLMRESSLHDRPIKLLARATIDSVEETLPWTLTLKRANRVHKFRNVVQETIRRNRDSCKNRQYQAARRSTTTTTTTSSESDTETGNINQLRECKTEDGRFELDTCSRCQNAEQNHERHNKSGKKATTTYLKEDFCGKNLTWQTDLVDEDNSAIENVANNNFTSDTDISDFDDIFATSTRSGTTSSGSNAPNLIKTTKNPLVSDGLEALGNDVKDQLIACATAAITANFLAAQQGSFRDAERGGCLWSSSNDHYHDQAYKRQEPAPPYTKGESPNYGNEKPNLTFDQTYSLHLSIDRLKLLIERNLVATLVGVYILISIAVITALILPYLFSIPRERIDTNEAAGDLINDAYKRAQKQIMDFERRPVTVLHEPNQEPNAALSHKNHDTRQNVSVMTGGTTELGNRSGTIVDDQSRNEKVQHLSETPIENSPLPLQLVEIAGVKQTEKRADHVFDQKTSIIGESDATDAEEGFMIGSKNNYSDLWKIHHNQSCQSVQVPFCSRSLESMFTMDFSSPGSLNPSPNLPLGPKLYDSTMLPNQFSRSPQSDIQTILDKYEPIIGVKCFALMRLFLCANFVPKCVQIDQTVSPQNHNQSANTSRYLNSLSRDNNSSASLDSLKGYSKGSGVHLSSIAYNSPIQIAKQKQQLANSTSSSAHKSRLVPPCKSLCKEAFRKCLFFFEVLSIKLIDPLDCESLPESTDPNVCIGSQELDWLAKANEQQRCPNDKFRCMSGECIPKKWRCDGFADCLDKDDEIKCSRCNMATQFYCGQDICINKEQVCNGIRDCRDGRDERQCLRLSQVVHPQRAGNQNQSRQLEVWSAVHEVWTPVCGSHWSAVPMSHEACQALGYSRANQTLFLFGPLTSSTINSSLVTTSPLSRLFSPNPNHPPKQITAKGLVRPIESDGSSNTYQNIFGTLSGLSKGHADESAPWAEIIEDMDGTVDRPYNRRGHEIVYGRQISASTQDKLINYRVAKDLMSIDAGEVKFKSLTSMLFHGSLAGCVNKPMHMVSTVNLVCDNFQCGRSITSYSTRIKSAQHKREQQLRLDAEYIEKAGHATWSARTGIGATRTSKDKNATYGPIEPTDFDRVQRLESHDDMDEVFDEENDNDEKLEEDDFLILDKVAKQQSRDSQAKGPISSRLVVGGIESMPGEFPYLAALHGGPDEIFFCGGVLISINWLLTAAHCVGNRTQPDGWMVKVGVTRRIASPTFVKKLKVSKIIKHSDFNLDLAYNNDIALILLEESVEFNQYLRPICLPKANHKLGPDNSKDCVVVGFGKSKFSQDANYLQVAHFANVPIVRRSLCSNWYQEHNVTLSEGMLCAGYAEGKRDACQGDSGSGLFCRYSSTNQFFVAGVVSFGIKCATPKLPGVYTSVPTYVDWIEATTREHGFPLN